jgi:hypothetical protein
MPKKTGVKTRAGIIGSVDSNVKLFALIALVVEGSLVAIVPTLPQEARLRAFYAFLGLFAITIVAVVVMEALKSKQPNRVELIPSPLTPDSQLLNDLINSAIHTVCRAVSLPRTPEEAKLRVFIFRMDGGRLVCSHYWAPNPAEEMVNQLSFKIDAQTAEKVAVVRAVVDRRICRTPVEPLPPDFDGAEGAVSADLSFVLAAPILMPDESVWGTVDFDAGNRVGEALLLTEVSDAAMFQLAQHLRIILALPAQQSVSG